MALLKRFVSGSKTIWPLDVSFTFSNGLGTQTVADSDGDLLLPVFTSDMPVKGTVTITPHPGKKVEHLGIRLELVGAIDLFFDKANSCEFVCTSTNLEGVGVLMAERAYDFCFDDVDKSLQSYYGSNFRLRYFVRVSLARQYGLNYENLAQLLVRTPTPMPEANPGPKMEVGIEDSLHIEFCFNQSTFALDDTIIGKVYFLLCKIKVERAELQLIKRETYGSGDDVHTDTTTIHTFELMDGAPVRGEAIPVRLHLSSVPDLTPTFKNVNNRFSVTYLLSLILIEEDTGARFFKSMEVGFVRR
jgi:vacuolar protein sorting-associated protein 26